LTIPASFSGDQTLLNILNSLQSPTSSWWFFPADQYVAQSS
jgi:hypothetical protein